MLGVWTLFSGLFLASAQNPIGSKAKNVEYPLYDSQQRLRSLILAQDAASKGNQQMELKGLTVESYAYNGNQRLTNMVVKSPQCLFNMKTREADSNSGVTAYSTDGRIQISAQSFHWIQQTNAPIILSNKVVIILGKETRQKEEGK